MQTLKAIVNRCLWRITFFSLILSLAIILFIQSAMERRHEYNLSMKIFSQIEQVLDEENQKELNFFKPPYPFSPFCVNPEATYYAIDAETGKIAGSTIPEFLGKEALSMGLNPDDIKTKKHGFFEVINGKKYYCVFKKIGNSYIGRTVLKSELYHTLPVTGIQITACIAIMALILSLTSTHYINKYVVKMSSILSRSNRYIGVYEYSGHIPKVRFTEHIPQIFALDEIETKRLTSDHNLFKAFIDDICQNPVPDETGVYKLCGQEERYVSIEELTEQNRTFGVAFDVTCEIARRRAIEFERDIDPLTGLYNRRGLDIRLTALFNEPEKLGYSAFIMIDADGLKTVNDTHGHANGDLYLKNISRIIRNYGPKCSLAARQSGDEFILFLYRYETQAKLLDAIHSLECMQSCSLAYLGDNTSVPLSFSMGYCLTGTDIAYMDLIKKADQKMYENKRNRKSCNN